MKTIKLLGILLIATFCSCSDGGGKFLGKWKSTLSIGSSRKPIITIEKQGDQYVLSNSLHPEQPIPFTYIEKNKMLTGNFMGEDVDIKYIDSSKHLSLTPRTSGLYNSSDNSLEFEKVD